MNKTERSEAIGRGIRPIRAQLTRKGWQVVAMTDGGGWSPLMDVVFANREYAVLVCEDLCLQQPEKYVNDNAWCYD